MKLSGIWAMETKLGSATEREGENIKFDENITVASCTWRTQLLLTVEPGALELGAYGGVRAAHQDGFRAQKVY